MRGVWLAFGVAIILFFVGMFVPMSSGLQLIILGGFFVAMFAAPVLAYREKRRQDRG